MKGSTSIILLVVMIAVMYLLLIRPQRKKEKETQAMRSRIKAGDEIVTIGGIRGKVIKVKDESLILQVGADRTKMEMMKWSVSKVEKLGPGHNEPEEEEKPTKSVPKRMDAPEPDEVEEDVEDLAEEADDVIEETEETLEKDK